jgi:hypothetical protein
VNEVCLSSDGSCVVPDPAQNCTPACQGDTRCIQRACVGITPLPPFRDLPRARGLWPSLALLPDGSALVAYYDNVAHDLKVAKVAGPDLAHGAITVTVVDGAGSGSTDDAGSYPSLFTTPSGDIHLAYLNTTRDALIYRTLDDTLAVVLDEVVESALQVGGPGGEYIGANPALLVDANGTVRIAYQNGSEGLLRYATRAPGMAPNWTLSTLRGGAMPYDGSFGFYTDQAFGAARMNPVLSTYRYFLSDPTAAPNGTGGNGLVVLSPP